MIANDLIEQPHSLEASRGDEPRNSQRNAGPLFKELYTGLVDVDDPETVGPMLEADRCAFLDHTTDIQTFAQFQSLHRLPEKWGTRYHHSTYLNTMDALQK